MTGASVERSSAQWLLTILAFGFGLATVAAGGSVLLGRDPGYVVYRPLVVFNTLMGVVYCAAGAAAWRSALRGRTVAGVILALNVVVLAAVVVLYRTGAAVAVDSVRAMVFRTTAWLALFLALAWLARRGEAR